MHRPWLFGSDTTGILPSMKQIDTISIEVTINGIRQNLAGPTTVSDLLASLGLDLRKVAVERNEEIVRRAAYADTVLMSGDALEIVHFIGGG